MVMHTNGPEIGTVLRLLKDENTYLRARNAQMQEALQLSLDRMVALNDAINNDLITHLRAILTQCE